MTRKGRNRGALPENRPRGPEHRHRVAAGAVRGVEQHKAKLNDDKVRLIRSSSLSGEALALQLGVTAATVSDVRTLKTWKHVTP